MISLLLFACESYVDFFKISTKAITNQNHYTSHWLCSISCVCVGHDSLFFFLFFFLIIYKTKVSNPCNGQSNAIENLMTKNGFKETESKMIGHTNKTTESEIRSMFYDSKLFHLVCETCVFSIEIDIFTL